MVLETGVSSLDSSNDIRFLDLQVLMEVLRTKSVREAARKLALSPGQVSKILKTLEVRLKTPLLERSSYGVEASAEAAALLPYLEGIQALRLRLAGELRPDERQPLLSIATSSFLSTHLLPQSLSVFQKEFPRSRFRLLDLPPGQFVPVALRGGFQICVHMGTLDWPRTWTTIEIGTIQWDLYCRTSHPMLKRPSLQHVLEWPFVYPAYWSDEGLRFGNDNCPLNIQKRIRGHETSTAVSAAEMVRVTDHLGFLPSLLTRQLVSTRALRKVPVKEWKPVRQTLYLSVKNDFVKQSVFQALKTTLSKELAQN